MNYSGKHLIILLLATVPLFVRAGGDEVVVVYNTRLPESKAIAEYYAKLRHVPAKQIFGFALTTDERMTRNEFRDSLQLPLAHQMEDAGLWRFGSVTNIMTNGQPGMVERRVVASQIRYVVLCRGVPLGIEPAPVSHEPGKEIAHPELLRDEAAVDSELAWLPLVEMGISLAGPLRNWVYGATNTAWLNPTNGVLLVARLDGPNADIARGLVDKALAAERDGMWGRAYFDARGLSKTDTNYYLGDEWILAGGEICRELGFETTVDKTPGTFPADFPMSQIAIYCGWYDGNVSGPFTLPKVEFMPGAFAYHLHSFSAATIRSTNEYWVGPLLAKGATCTMGCVNEPYLAFTPNVAAFLARWIGGGFTFGEAAWAAQPVLILANDRRWRPALSSVWRAPAATPRRTRPPPQFAHRMVLLAPDESGPRQSCAGCFTGELS